MRALTGSHQHGGHASGRGHGHDGTGELLDLGWRYDLGLWFFDTFVARGTWRQMRSRVLELARPTTGEALIDAGCGTGTLAIAAAGLVGPDGTVVGVDGAPRQLARAQAKARRAEVHVELRQASVTELPFADDRFDVATSTLMLHHLPEQLRTAALAEIARVVRPGGRIVVADAEPSAPAEPGARPDAGSPAELLASAGFTDISAERHELGRPHQGWQAISIASAIAPR